MRYVNNKLDLSTDLEGSDCGFTHDVSEQGYAAARIDRAGEVVDEVAAVRQACG